MTVTRPHTGLVHLGLTPASRSRIKAYAEASAADDKVDRIEMVMVWKGLDGVTYEAPMDGSRPAVPHDPDREPIRRERLLGDL